jgi:PKD repeat protein
MKKLLFSFVAIVLTMTVMSQSQRQMVLAEDFTSTLCTYCPGCAMGMDDLLANGKYVAVISEHSNFGSTDPYKNTYSLQRNSMYNVQAFPTVSFDGWEQYTGGSHTSSLYTTYLPIYNTCIATPSPVTMSMNVTNSGLNYTAVVTLTRTDVITSSSNILFFFVTQSNISYNWEGQTHLEHVNRLMAPDAFGTAIDFTSGDTQTVTLNFTMDSSWPLADCEFVAAFQNKDGGQGNQSGTPGGYPIKEYKVYQAIKRGAIDLTPGFASSDTMVPLNGSVSFTNNTFGGYVGTPETFHWIFDGGTPDTSDLQNPTVTYSTPGYHDVTLIVNKGGQIDTLTKTAYIYVGNVGITQLSKNDVSIFPNPNQGTFNLQMNSLTAQNINIEIRNSLGVKVYSENGITFCGNLNKTIKLNNAPAGIYFMTIVNSGKNIVEKFLVK